jgi:hypothetical protein
MCRKTGSEGVEGTRDCVAKVVVDISRLVQVS